MGATDGQLVARAREGDREAFGDLVDRYRDMVYGLGYHLTHDFEAARDLAQEAFVQAYLKLGQLRDPDRFSGWLRRIATNLHRNQRQRREVKTVSLAEAGEVADGRRPSEIEVVVREALARLRAPERLALTLHYINGYSQAEIGAFLGVRPETVKTRLARARQHLRTEVMAMVEDAFEQHALPEEFRRDVIRAVDDLVTRLKAALPEDVPAMLARLRRDVSWCGVLDRMPAPYGRPLSVARVPEREAALGSPIVEQEHDRKVRVADLPEDLQRDVRRLICCTWAESVLSPGAQPPPWLRDPGVLWLRFSDESEPGWWTAAFTDAAEGSASIATVGVGPEKDHPQGPPTPVADVDRALAACDAPAELRDLVLRLRTAVPGAPGSLGLALYAEVVRLLREVREKLPADLRAAMETGRRVSIKEMPPALQETLRQALFLEWGGHVVDEIEHAPSYLLRVDEASIEFGLMPQDFPGHSAGSVYLRLYGPAPYANTLWTTLDCKP
jgi:RNA polymerase sigma factor (sigma-70 family)